MLDWVELGQTSAAISVMDYTIMTVLKEGGAQEEMELWEINHKQINMIWANGGRRQHKEAHIRPTLLNWVISKSNASNAAK